MAPSKSPTPATDDEQDNYLTMTFPDSSTSTTRTQHKPTLTQLQKQKALRQETAGRPKSKIELAKESEQKRSDALKSSTLDPTNKGLKMMAALGYTPGTTLGKSSQNGLLEPVGMEMKSDRSGIGRESEKKRKIREEYERMEGEEKRRKVDAEEYRERVVREREEKRREGQLVGARKVVIGLEEEEGERDEKTQQEGKGEGDAEAKRIKSRNRSRKPLKQTNILYRALIRDTERADRDKRLRHDLLHSSSTILRTNYDDTEEDADDKLALQPNPTGGDKRLEIVDDADLDEEDTELDEFEALGVPEKLDRVVSHLREKWHYCFWCKFRYPDATMDGCPGLTEEDHD